MVQLPRVKYFVTKKAFFIQSLVPSKEMPHKLCKGHVKTPFGTSIRAFKHVSNLKFHGYR